MSKQGKAALERLKKKRKKKIKPPQAHREAYPFGYGNKKKKIKRKVAKG